MQRRLHFRAIKNLWDQYEKKNDFYLKYRSYSSKCYTPVYGHTFYTNVQHYYHTDTNLKKKCNVVIEMMFKQKCGAKNVKNEKKKLLFNWQCWNYSFTYCLTINRHYFSIFVAVKHTLLTWIGNLWSLVAISSQHK